MVWLIGGGVALLLVGGRALSLTSSRRKQSDGRGEAYHAGAGEERERFRSMR